MRVSPQNASDWFPDLTADPSGTVHLVWASSEVVNSQRYDTIWYTALKDGQVIVQPVNIEAQPTAINISAAARPTIIYDPIGKLHLTFRDEGSTYYAQVPTESAKQATQWRFPKSLGGGYFVYVKLDSKGRLHGFITENVPTDDCDICFHIFHIYSDDDGLNWSERKDVSVVPLGAAKPQILFDKDDNILIAWEMGRGGTFGHVRRPNIVAYAASYDRGNSWSTPVTFVPTNAKSEARTPSLALDGKGNLILVFHSQTDDFVYYMISTDKGRNWSSPQRIPNLWGTFAVVDSVLDCTSMAVDSAGVVHLISVGRTTQDQAVLSVVHTTWNGSWGSPEIVHTQQPGPTGDYPQWPRIAIGEGNKVHVAWYLRRGGLQRFNSDEEIPNYEIWYSTASVNAPFIPPQPVPTLAPAATARAASTAIIVPTQAPALSPAQQLPPNPGITLTDLRRETDDYMRLGISLVPAIAVLILVFGILRLRRR